ncbi:hypothetical protein QYF36_021512 [Acer negundo]|nr:hypothetical protein QYF36_021512 [Acer negundo]
MSAHMRKKVQRKLKIRVNSSIIDKGLVHRVISLLLEAEATIEEDSASRSSHSAIRVIDSFLVPKFHYNPIKKHFYQHTGSVLIHGEASAKAELYKDRFLLLFQRVCRDGHSSTPEFNAQTSEFGRCEICTIQSLIGQPGKRWVMGVISQLEDGHFYLEDLSAIFYREHHCFSRRRDAHRWYFPGDRDKSFKLLEGHDIFGGGALTKEETLRLADLEKRAVNDMFVILSDIWLDNEETMGKLEIVLNRFESKEVVPSLSVFMGNFCSHPFNLSFHSFSSLRLQFGKLGQMIAAHPCLKDHSPSTALPRCALPKYLTKELQKYIPNDIFSSNPCRIKFYTRDHIFSPGSFVQNASVMFDLSINRRN